MNTKPVALLAALLCCVAVHAAPPQGVYFRHGDWEIACDNTRTCRAAGYQPDAADDAGKVPPVSVLLTRKAGPRAPVLAELQIGNDGPGDDVNPGAITLAMRIDGKPLGPATIAKGTWTTTLSAAQTNALLAALPRRSRIEWTDGKSTWRLSDEGAAAVLLKMDDVQGRAGTPGALVRKGTRDEGGVLPAVAPPVVVAARVPDDDKVELPAAALRRLKTALAAILGDDCGAPDDVRHRLDDLQLSRLSGAKMLASITCSMGNTHTYYAHWIVDTGPPFAPQLVTTEGGNYSHGVIDDSGNGGSADCWNVDERTWDGTRFVQTALGTTGLCKGVATGGPWSLPTVVATVRRPAP